jgi:hypothetical protein
LLSTFSRARDENSICPENGAGAQRNYQLIHSGFIRFVEFLSVGPIDEGKNPAAAAASFEKGVEILFCVCRVRIEVNWMPLSAARFHYIPPRASAGGILFFWSLRAVFIIP